MVLTRLPATSAPPDRFRPLDFDTNADHGNHDVATKLGECSQADRTGAARPSANRRTIKGKGP